MPRTPRALPEQAYLQARLDYCPETGALTWKEYPGQTNAWNALHAGKRAGSVRGDGRGKICLDYVQYLTARVIWKWLYGNDPVEVDHVDGDVSNNRAKNLRSTNRSSNMRNRRLSRNSTSGHVGVTWDASRDRWIVNVCKKHVGRFETLSEAVAARSEAEKQIGRFTERHGSATERS